MEKIENPASDMEIVLFLGYHIKNPCGVEVNGKWENIRPFYIARAENVLPTLTNPFAKKLLESLIKNYS